MADTHGALRLAVAEADVWRRLVGARIRADLQYRVAFGAFVLAQFFVAAADLGVLLVIFSTVDALAGWDRAEVLLLFGLSGTAFGLADATVAPVERVSRHVRDGTFDQFLTRPAGALWQLLGAEFELRRIGRLVQPLAVLAIVLFVADIGWTPAAVVLVPVALVSGTVIYGSLWVATASIAFWTVESQELGNTVTYGGNALSKYPLDVYTAWMRRAVTFAVPLAFVAYLPGAWLLGKPLPAGVPSWAIWATPAVAATAALVARRIWQTAIRHYRSTGS